MTLKSSQQIGKDFEKTLESVFSSLQKTNGLRFHKFVDSHAAGNIVASQPSDYLVGFYQKLILVEAKSSATKTNFTRSALRPAQKGAALFYGQLLDIPYVILFHSEKTGMVSYIDGAAAMAGDRINLETCVLDSRPLEQLTDMLKSQWEMRSIKFLTKRKQEVYGE